MTKMRSLVGLLIVGIIVYAGLWFTSAFRAEKETAALFTSWRDKGLKVDHGKIKLSGFPYRFVITVDGLQVKTRGPGLDFGAESLMFVSHLWTPGHWVAEARNVSLVAADGAIELTDGTMRGSYRIHEGGQAMIVVDSGSIDDFRLEKALGLTTSGTLRSWQLFLRTEAEHADKPAGLYEDRFLDFKFTLDTGSTQFEATGGIMGPVVRDWTERELSAWRDAGGLLELDDFTLATNGGHMKGNASLTLDETFKPLGSASLAVDGTDAVADIVDRLGLEVLGQEIMRNDQQGLSLSMQMGSLSFDGVPLLPLKPLLSD